MTERFSTMDTADTYEKRIKPYAQGLVYADILPYLYTHMPQYIEMRLRHANPPDLGTFFTDLRRIWLESRGRIPEQQPYSNQALPTQPQKDDFKIRLAKDLGYTGIGTDDATLENFIYGELKKRLGGQTAHVRKSPFTPRNAYATKKLEIWQRALAKVLFPEPGIPTQTNTTYQKIIDNTRPPEPTEEWRKIIDSVNISDQISENNQESSHDTSFSAQEDGIIHTEHPADDENGSDSHINSNSLNTVTNGRKDKVSRKKKASMKSKDESPSSVDKVANSFKDDTSRRESDLKKLLNISREAIIHPIYSP
ncbi:hypothetical protein RclHR1_35120001 [Rhizophagus clarus]|uniref:Uncharacterized protein n=1 Tax=Rhizophagus clarus TaxID=94130 RepID=A0A2Z6RAM5_9GLOM|nr:hypothetical protein RclHR1_35120001 [Rhizophagus clarus]